IALSFLARGGQRGAAVALRFLGRDASAVPAGTRRAPGVVNDLRGSDPARWRTGIPRYRAVVYRDLWPGIDLRVDQRSGVLAYEFRVRPGADPSRIRLAYAGAQGLAVDGSGALRVRTSLGTLRDTAPVTYQVLGGSRAAVPSSYTLGAGGRFGFRVG